MGCDPRDRGKSFDFLIGDEPRVGRGITDGDLIEGHVVNLHVASSSFCPRVFFVDSFSQLPVVRVWWAAAEFL